MTRFFVSTGKYCVGFLLALLLASPLNAQLTLREALDFDGDGKVDYSVFRPSNSGWFVLGSTGSVLVQAFGSPNDDFITPGDYDGDNKADFAVFREPTGIWYILKSSDNTVYGFPWGGLGDEPVARDYDGDGKTDAAVVRRQNNVMVWWILRSSDFGHNVYQWGSDSDFVAPGDYDGDGRFDIGVQRGGDNSTDPAFFYILQTTAGFRSFQFGFTDDAFVPGDYDGDGRTDVAIVHEDTASNSLVWYIQPSTGNGEYYGIPWGSPTDDVFAQGDYDGDNRTDIAIFRNSTGFFWVLFSGNGAAQGLQWGARNDMPIAGYDTH